MKTLKTLAMLFDRFIWSIGLMTIIFYAQDHWPTFYFVTACVLLGGFAIWYLWRFFLIPFREGLRGHSDESHVAK
jgi:hypothetical protein